MAWNKHRQVVGSAGSSNSSAARLSPKLSCDLRIGPRLSRGNPFELFIHAPLKCGGTNVDWQIRKIDLAIKAPNEVIDPIFQLFARIDKFRFGKLAFEFLSQTRWIIP